VAILAVVTRQLELQGVRLGDYVHEPEPITVDFVFGQARPRPMAIEVTRLVSQVELAGSSAMDRHLTDRLNGLARAEGLGHWQIHVDIGADQKVIADVASDCMRQGIEIPPGGYTSDELLAAEPVERADLVARHRSAHDAGILFLHRLDGDENKVAVGGQSSGVKPILGFGRALQQTIDAKSAQLEAARPMETHLAVDVWRWDFAGEPDETLPPQLPAAIDQVWILHRWAGIRSQPNLWWARRDAFGWEYARVVFP
jgi:hypothetical protein